MWSAVFVEGRGSGQGRWVALQSLQLRVPNPLPPPGRDARRPASHVFGKQKTFFQEANSVIKVAPKNARWSLVRSKLSTSLEEFHTEKSKTTVSCEWLPLSVWEKRGFNTSLVQEKGDSRNCPVFGEVWTAPLTTVKSEDIRGQVHRTLAEKEWAVKKLKTDKKRGKGKTAPDAPDSGAAAAASGAGTAVLVDSDAWSIPSSDEEKQPRKVPKQGKNDDAGAARKEARQLASKWKQEVGKAAKSMAQLNSLSLTVAALLDKSSKNPDLLTGEVQDGLKEGGVKLCELKSRATQLLSATDADKSAGPPRALEQAEDELSKSIKAAQEVVKDAKWAFSMGKRRLTGEDQERLHKAIRVPGASERAVLEIWNIVKDDEAPMRRGGFMPQVHLQLERWKRCLVPTTFSLLDGSTVDIPILNLQEALKAFCTDPDTAAFANALKKGLSQTGMVTPIIFADECTAGNVLAANKSRKAMIYNLSWLELWHLLKNQHAWLPVALVQSTCLNKLRGGASAIMLAILRQNVSAANVEGFPLNDGIFFRQNQEAWFLGDHDAVRAVFSLKGSAGLRPCVFCRNVVKAASGVVEIDEDFKEISAANGFDLASDSDIFRLCDSLLQPMSKKDREMKERCCGVTCSPDTLLFDPSERLKMPPSRIMYDFMHTYLHNGCASREIHLFLTNIFSLTEVTREILQGAVVAAAWKATRSSGRNARYLERLFADFMFGDETYKGQANETDAALPLVRFYMETMMVPGGCYLVATSLGPGDIIIWRKYGGIIVQWFCSSYDGLY
ncbi:Uncharacterized protein SCF082_LOCUS42049, partial [Durusdinium trenchii]